MKITAVCGNGLGTSLMMEMSIKSILKDSPVSADVGHVDLSFTKRTSSNIYVDTKDIVEQLAAQSVTGKIVILGNMINKKAIRKRLFMVLTELGAL